MAGFVRPEISWSRKTGPEGPSRPTVETGTRRSYGRALAPFFPYEESCLREGMKRLTGRPGTSCETELAESVAPVELSEASIRSLSQGGARQMQPGAVYERPEVECAAGVSRLEIQVPRGGQRMIAAPVRQMIAPIASQWSGR